MSRASQCILFLGIALFVHAIVAVAEEDVIATPVPVIRDIRVEIRDIFDGPELAGFYRTVNNIKISTKVDVILRELLFKVGDPLDKFLLEESERNLRRLPFLRRVSIIPITVDGGKSVDVIVSVQDTWTLFPQISFSTGSGSDKKSIGLAETNVLGYGKRLEALYADDEGREKIEAVWDDRRVMGTYQRLLLGNYYRSDGFRSVTYYGRPFRSFTDEYSWNINGDFSDLVGRLFENSEERFIYRNRHEEAEARYVFAFGDADKLLHRVGLGYEFINDEFEQADEEDFEDVDVDPDSVSQDPALLADDRRFSGPFIAYNRIIPDFISLNYVDRFERVEDFNLGNDFSAKINLAPEALDSKEDTLLLSLGDSDGFRFSPTSFLRGELGLGTRLNDVGFSNTLVRGELKYYNVLGSKYLGDTYIGKHTIAASLSLDYGDDLDLDREFLLGADNGLRGYSTRTFTGDKRLIINLEERFHIVEDLFRLISIGGAFFIDGGGTTTNDFGEIISNNFYSDIGFGLRFGFPRASGSGIARLDIGFPLRDGPDGSAQFEPRIIFTTGPPFGARLRSETAGAENANVTVGLDR